MHFAIPDIENLKEKGKGSYTSYVIYLNGIPHSSLRYSRIREISEYIKINYGNAIKLPQFPAKNILMSDFEVEDRRDSLEKYLQTMAQSDITLDTQLQELFVDAQLEFHKRLGTLDTCLINNQKNQSKYIYENGNLTKTKDYELIGDKSALLSLQKGTYKLPIYYSIIPSQKNIEVEVLLPNTNHNQSKCPNTHSLLLESLSHLGISHDYISYFALYIVQLETSPEDQDYLIYVNQLTDMECPYLTLESLRCMNDANATNQFYIYLRTSYWDIRLDQHLRNDEMASMILYYQLLNETRTRLEDLPLFHPTGHVNMMGSNDTDTEVTSTYSASFQILASRCPTYGFLWLRQSGSESSCPRCLIDFPQPDTPGDLYIGLNGILFVLRSARALVDETKSEVPKNRSPSEYRIDDRPSIFFKTSRIKSWRVTSYPVVGNDAIGCGAKRSLSTINGRHYGPRVSYKFTFQYLVSDQELRWISIQIQNPLFLSSCLQGMVRDLLRWESTTQSPVLKPSLQPAEPKRALGKLTMKKVETSRPFPEFIQLKECSSYATTNGTPSAELKIF